MDLLAFCGLSGSDLNSASEEPTTHSLVPAAGFEKTYHLHRLTHHPALSQAARKSKAKEHRVQGRPEDNWSTGLSTLTS